MSNIIQFSRDEIIESSYDVAIIKLNTFNHVVGQPVLVRYYDSQSRVNSILAVGILDGPGKENYTIISNGAIEPVTGVYNTRLPDVSSLVNNEVYVCYDSNDVPSYCYLEGAAKSYTPITIDKTFYSALDGFLWFVSNGVIRRSDAPIDQSTLAGLIQELVDNGSLEIREATKNFYTWSEKPDGVVSSGEYAKVFDIPYGHSVIMAVFVQAPFGNYYADIITYGKGSGNWGYSLTTKTKDFLVAKSGNQPMAVVHRAVSNSNQYFTTYKFMVLSSTCGEDQIQWFTKEGWSGDVYELTSIGGGNTRDSLDNYITLDYGNAGTATANLRNGSNFIADTRNCKGKSITTKLTNIPSNNDSYKFIVNSDVLDFNVIDGSNRPLLSIPQKLYSGTVVTITKVDGVWTYSTTSPNIISSDSSIEITTTSNGQSDIVVSGGNSNKEFVWDKNAGLSTFVSSGVTQYSWVRVLDINQELFTHDTLISVEFKCKELGTTGNLSFSVDNNSVYLVGNHEFYKKVSENFEFGKEENISGGYYIYVRPKYSTSLKTFEVKTISAGVTWDYSSTNASIDNPNPYKTKNSFLSPLSLEIFTTDQVTEGSDKLVTSGAVYSKIGELVAGNTEGLVDRIVALEENTVTSITVNGDTILPEEGDADLGILYGPDNTEILNNDTVINGVLAKRGSLVLLDSNGQPISIICLSSNSKFYKFTANSLGWWNLGEIDGNSGIRVSVSGNKLSKVTGDIWKLGNNKYVTNNETLSGYIKDGGGNLVIKGSSVHPVIVEIEDYSEDFNYVGTVLSSAPTVSTIGVTRSDAIVDAVNLSNSYTSSDIPTVFYVSKNTNPSINIQKSESSVDCFVFNIVFKDSLSKSLVVNLGVGSSDYSINLPRITTAPGLIYTVTYKQDELIYTTKVDSTNPLTVSDLGVSVEAISNKVVSITEESTDDQYPTAKAVWNIFKGKYTQDFKKTAEYDSANMYPFQAALKVTTPAILDVYWSNDSGTFSDTLYVNGKKGSPGTYNVRCHNQLGVFSLKYYGGDFYVCIPALPSSSSSANTYNFIMSAVGKGAEVTSSLFFNSTIPSSFVGESVEFIGDQIYNLDSTASVTDFNFQDYDTILATFPSGNSVSIKGTTLPGEDKIYSFINNTGRDLTNVYVEGRNGAGIISKINIGNVQAGAIVTLAYIESTNSFDYSISLQSFISPNRTIDITKGVDQWKFDISSELLDKINNPIQVSSVLSEGTKIATVGDTDIFISPEAGQEELTISPTVTVGGITAGMDLDNMTPGEILRQMLTPYVGPRITSMTVSTPVMLYGKTYTDIIVKAVGKAGSEAVKNMIVDGSIYTDTVSLSKSKRIDSITPRDSSISEIIYNSSISDVNNTVGTGSTRIQLVGGVFIFFSTSEDLPTTNLDFVTYGCQGEKAEIKGIYENIYHEDEAYLYIVAPNTSNMEIKTIKSSGYAVPIDLIGTRTLRQGTGDLFVSVDMRIYRSDKKHKPGYFSCEINNPTI